MVVRQDSFLVEREHFRDVKFTVNNSVSKDLFHHSFLWGFAVSSTNKIAIMNSWQWRTIFISTALDSLCLSKIWWTLLRDHMSILSKVPVEERPATVTAFVHVVAGHEVLGWMFWNIGTILKFQTWFYDLSERYCVARAASSLISDRAHEIIAVEICKLIGSWQFAIRDVFSSFVLLCPALSRCQCLLKAICVFTENFRIRFRFGGSLDETDW